MSSAKKKLKAKFNPNAFLSNKGRIIATSLMYNITPVDNADGMELLVETHKSMTQGLLAHLKMYKLRSKVKILLQEKGAYASRLHLYDNDGDNDDDGGGSYMVYAHHDGPS